MVWRGGFVRRPQTIDMGMCVVPFCAILTTEREKSFLVGKKATVEITSFHPHCFFFILHCFGTVPVVFSPSFPSVVARYCCAFVDLVMFPFFFVSSISFSLIVGTRVLSRPPGI